ncbi:MAG: tryptophan synthase subunit alpha [Chloroflexi bacterium]|nr:tryptophan synthase subunit alpha [Chloroflexota bacterium]
MNRIEEKFVELGTQQRAALMPYLPLGYPTVEESQDLIRVIADAGADMIELGVPFSDPLADGPVIQHATQVALKNGVTLAKCLAMARAARDAGVTIPLILMGYANPILRYGIAAFARDAQNAGVDGLIVPDLPPEEAGAFDAATRAHDLALIFLAAPTSTPERLQKIAAATRGFVYLVSVVGVTGARAQLAADLSSFVARVRAITSKPVCVGFGIANAESARQVAQIADGVIVGSALVNKIGNGNAIQAAREFIAELRGAINHKIE